MNRGRSRAVSTVALARLHSEERSDQAPTPPLARSPSPLSEPPSRSPSPLARTLSDQVHIAYAHDDIHLAKVLLLRLQGIEVTSDSDPRIAAVKDEDFDACFVPFGRMDDAPSVPSTSKANIKPPLSDTRRADQRRADALRAKELLWEFEARRFTEERVRCTAQKHRQTDRACAASAEQERVRLAKQKEAAAAAIDLRRRRMKPTARTLNFSLVAPVPPPPKPRYTYDFPFTPRRIAPVPRVPVTLSPRRSPVKAEPREDSPARQANRITFQQVLARMDGPLFPVLPGERCTSTDRRRRALLDALLSAGVDLSFSRNGKAKARATIPLRCSVCAPPRPASPASSLPSPSPSTPSTSSSGLSRAGSWLSFGSSSRASTASTTGTSVASSWVSASTLLSSPSDSPTPPAKAPRLWLPGARRTASPSTLPAPQCRCAPSAPPRAPAPTHPLLPPIAAPRAAAPRRPPHMDTDPAAGRPAVPFTLALGRLVALARNLQAAYVRAVVVGYGTETYDDAYGEGRESVYAYAYEKPLRPRPPPLALACSLRPRPAGLRAACADVRRFLSERTPACEADELAPIAPLVPWRAPAPRVAPAPPARTQHAPYTLVFVPPVPLPRSPWAPAVRGHMRVDECAAECAVPAIHAPIDESDPDADSDTREWTRGRPALRARAVPNSAFLRLKALHNSGARGLVVVNDLWPPSASAPRTGNVYAANEPYAKKGSARNASPSPSPSGKTSVSVRRPRECLVALGVDRVPGSRLRFVYAKDTVGVVGV